MVWLSDKYHGSEDLLLVDLIYIVFVEAIMLADISICICCAKRWKNLMNHLAVLACLGVGDILLLTTSLWVNIRRWLENNSSLVTVCDTYLSSLQENLLTKIPQVDAIGVLLFLVYVYFNNGCRLPRGHLASLFILAVPWVLSIILVLSFSLILNIDMCICDNFTYDRYMGFSASRLVYILMVVGPVVAALLMVLISCCGRRRSRKDCTKAMDYNNTCGDEKDSAYLLAQPGTIDIKTELSDTNKSIYLLSSSSIQEANTPTLRQAKTEVMMSFRCSLISLLFLSLVVVVPVFTINISQLIETPGSSSSERLVKLYSDICLWLYYLRTAATPIVWIAYINT